MRGVSTLLDLEAALVDEAFEFACFAGDLLDAAGTLFGGFLRFGRGCRNLLKAAADFFGRAALLGGGGGDGVDHLGHVARTGHDSFEVVSCAACFGDTVANHDAAFVHGGDGGLGVALDLADGLADFGGCLLRAVGELAHFVGDDGKASAVFACAGGFNRSVEGEQVGLIGDVVDDLDHLADGFAALAQRVDALGAAVDGFFDGVHAVDCACDGFAAFGGHAA